MRLFDCIGTGPLIIPATEKSAQPKRPTEVRLDETGIEFDADKID